MKELIKNIQSEFYEAIDPLNLKLCNDPVEKVNLIMGIKGVGKTHYLFQKAKYLLNLGVPRERLFYINFSDARLLPFKHSMRQIIENWIELHPTDEKCYFLLDEVHGTEIWPLVVRKFLDTKNVEIYITGTAKLKNNKFFETIADFCSHQELFPSINQEPSSLLWGGMPNLPKCKRARVEYFQEIVDRIIFDIQISNISLLKNFIYYLFQSISFPFSINKFYQDIKSQGIRVAKDTLHNYLAYLEEEGLFYCVAPFDEKKETSPKKIYAADNGFISSFKAKENLLTLYKNHIYLDLKQQGKSIYYYQTKKGENIDFLTLDKGRPELVQVVLNAECSKEKKALERAMQELKIPGNLITLSKP